ncbi:hypothetical protein CALCODRAFT_488776 [Calocera cornea HHB12733]|uniref:Uncharacterized protein n=1 Tax=Calocera cornea HHB12733 TaxID=1353952 RepID=A0A165C701_9BASI|nr:hypothetical protein CALCODRAFT_488776 [Calocera cornea HHB12733]
MSASSTLPLLYALYRLLNPPLPTPLDYLPLIFRLLALSIAGPFLFITFLEVAGYLVVRTLGFTTRLPGSAASSRAGSATSSPSSEKPLLPAALGLQPIPVPVPASEPHNALSDAQRTLAPPPQILIPATNVLRSPTPGKYETYFATPGEHDFRLSGTGLFSPPDSREGSPPHSSVGLGGAEGRSSALGLGMDADVRSRTGMNGLKALTPVEAR